MRTGFAIVPILAACVAGNPPGVAGRDGSVGEVPLEGGSLVLDHCGDALTTRPGASAPVPGSAVLGASPAPTQIHLGLARDPATSVVVGWTTDVDTLASTVRYGVGRALDLTQEGATFLYNTGFGTTSTVRVHETHLCGLAPDTVYSYQVGGVGEGGVERWSDVFEFRTAPAPGTSDEIVVAVLGDSRDGYEVLQQMIALAAEQAPDLVLFSGDAVTLGQLQEEWDAFFTAAEPLIARVPMVSAHGNHDLNAIPFYSQFAMPGDEEHFGLDYGPVHLTVLNDSPSEIADIRGKAASFLDADLTAHGEAPWKFLMHHRPMWSAAANHGGDPELLEVWGPIVDQHAVDLVLNGHDHDYERSKPMRGTAPQATPAEGTIHIVSGGAGATLYENGADFWTEVSAKSHSLLILRVTPSTLQMTALTESGSQLDSLSITKAAVR